MGAKRTGNRVQDIAPDRLGLLNGGTVEVSTLTECLGVDFAALLRAALPSVGEDAALTLEREAATGISRRMALAARLILDQLGPAAVDRLRIHPSDTVRGWVCFMIGAMDGVALPDRLAMIRPLADDRHFGVREWAWLAVRPRLAADLENAMALLSAWTADPSERLRRFASEATRPRGVWCSHIKVLRQNPEMALRILEPLRADPAAYVQDSVGNWLNDASKDRPDWVRALVDRWTRESSCPATARICKRALRSLSNKAGPGVTV